MTIRILRIILVVLMLYTLVGCAGATSVEVLKQTVINWDMETWTDTTHVGTWTQSGTFLRTGNSYTGSYAVSTYSGSGYIEQTVDVVGGADVDVSVWMKTAVGGSSGFQLTFYDAVSSQVGSTQYITYSGTGSWKEYHKRVESPSGAETMKLRLINWNAGYTTYFDTVALTQPITVSATETIEDDWSYTTFSYYQYSGYTSFVYEFDGVDIADHGKLDDPVLDVGGSPSAYIYYVDGKYILYPTLSTGSHTIEINQSYNLPPDLLTPTDGSSWDFEYPPLYDDVTFTWEDTGTTCQIQVAEDSTFSNVVYSTDTTTDTATCSLAASTYYWRVRSYDSIFDSWGDWASYYDVVVSSSAESGSGTGVQGTTYYAESVGNYQYIEGAVVTLYNDSFTNQRTTGGSGYYQILGLTGGTYYILVEAEGYDDSNVVAVTVVNGSISTQDIAMQVEQNYFQPNYVKFIIKSKSALGLVKTAVSGATVEVYQGDNVDSLFSQVTGDDGAVGFELSEDTRYRIEVTYGDISQIEYVTPVSSSYNIILDEEIDSIVSDSDFYSTVDVEISKDVISDSHAQITVYYNDTVDGTSFADVYLFSVDSETGEREIIEYDAYISSPMETTFDVYDYDGKTYVVLIDITHDVYGNVEKTYAVSFPGSFLPFTGKGIAYLGVIVCFFVAAMFGQRDVGPACIITSGIGYIFWTLNMFVAFGDDYNDLIGTGTILALVFSVIVVFGEKRDIGRV